MTTLFASAGSLEEKSGCLESPSQSLARLYETELRPGSMKQRDSLRAPSAEQKESQDDMVAKGEEKRYNEFCVCGARIAMLRRKRYALYCSQDCPAAREIKRDQEARGRDRYRDRRRKEREEATPAADAPTQGEQPAKLAIVPQMLVADPCKFCRHKSATGCQRNVWRACAGLGGTLAWREVVRW